MSIISDFTFPSDSGVCQIHVRQWLPDEKPYAGIVQLMHGISEHIGRYDAFARFLNDCGYIVVGNDHLGHGASVASEDDLGYFCNRDGWRHVSNDTRILQIMTKRAFPNLPYFLFGHSMGSFLTRTFLIRFPNVVDGAILCGTAQMPWTQLRLFRGAAAAERLHLGRRGKSTHLGSLSFEICNHQFEPTRTPFDWLSSSQSNVDHYMEDPLCGVLPTVGMFLDVADGLLYLRTPSNVSRMAKDTPLFIISGECDPMGEQGAGIRRLFRSYKKSGLSDLRIRIYPEMRHEILNEVNCAAVYDDVITWLNEKSRRGA